MSRRQLGYQILIIAAIAFAGYWLVTTTQANLARIGVDSNIDFLWRRAGFDISQTLIAFDANSTLARAFLVALLNTCVLALAAIVGASVLGFVIGISRLSSNWLVARLAGAYVELFRNIPSLLQIFFWYLIVLRFLPRTRDSLTAFDTIVLNNRGLYLPAPVIEQGGSWIAAAVLAALGGIVALRYFARYLEERGRIRLPVALPGAILLAGLPGMVVLTGLAAVAWDIPQPGRFSYEGGLVLMPEFLALVVGLSMYHATYIGEIVRSGFASIPRGQLEAADALGLSRRASLRLVLYPQALRVMIPPLTTVYLNLFKGTSLAAAIAYPEVVSVFVGTVNNLVGQPVVIMGMTLLVYASVSLCIALLLNWYNRRIRVTGAA